MGAMICLKTIIRKYFNIPWHSFWYIPLTKIFLKYFSLYFPVPIQAKFLSYANYANAMCISKPHLHTFENALNLRILSDFSLTASRAPSIFVSDKFTWESITRLELQLWHARARLAVISVRFFELHKSLLYFGFFPISATARLRFREYLLDTRLGNFDDLSLVFFGSGFLCIFSAVDPKTRLMSERLSDKLLATLFFSLPFLRFVLRFILLDFCCYSS